jgi:hypothetical protein
VWSIVTGAAASAASASPANVSVTFWGMMWSGA